MKKYQLNKPLIIIPIETKVREFHGKLFFSYLAVLKGYSVVVGDQNQLWKYADLFSPGIYIDKSVAATRIDWFQQLKQMGHRIISWDEEGLIYFSEEVYEKLRLAEDAFKCVELFFCWGERQKEIIVKNFPQMNGHVHTCGNPRFDLLRKEYRSIFQPEADALNRKYGRILLINTNFSFYNHYRSSEELKVMLESYPLSTETGFMEGWVAYHKAGFDSFRNLLPLLSKQFQNHTIVIRPHPSENHDVWREVSEEYSNIIVNAEGNVHEWIMASDLLLHDNCTTAVESFILGVPPFAYREDRKEQYDNFLPRVLSYNTASAEELIASFKDALSGNKKILDSIWSDENYKHLDYYVSGLQGKSSVDEMLDKISKTFSDFNSELSGSEKRIRKLKLHWRNMLNLYRSRRVKSDGYTEQKFSGISKAEIEDILSSIDQTFGNSTSFDVKKVTKDLFSISLQS